MTTSIRIDLPIAPGAKTCEGCDRYNDHDHCGDWCEPFKQRLPISGVRLPECLASEREFVGKYFDAKRQVHVTRYRRRA